MIAAVSPDSFVLLTTWVRVGKGQMGIGRSIEVDENITSDEEDGVRFYFGTIKTAKSLYIVRRVSELYL